MDPLLIQADPNHLSEIKYQPGEFVCVHCTAALSFLGLQVMTAGSISGKSPC